MRIRDKIRRIVSSLTGSNREPTEVRNKRIFLECLSVGCATGMEIRRYFFSKGIFLTKKEFFKLALRMEQEGLIVERLARYDGFLLRFYMIDNREKSHIKKSKNEN